MEGPADRCEATVLPELEIRSRDAGRVY